MPVKDYNANPDLNTQISGINIAEGCAPSGINNAIRQLMADVKEESEAQAQAAHQQAMAQAQAVGEAKESAAEQVSALDTTLRALIAEELAKYLPLAGGTMTGPLAIAEGGACLRVAYPNHESGSAPSEPRYTTIAWCDKNGVEIGRILGFMNSTGQGGLGIRHANADGTYGPSFAVGTNADGTGFCTYDSKKLVAVESSSFTSDKGYIKFTTGLLIHWVQGKATNNQIVTANFSPAFSSVTSYVVVATGRYGGSDTNYNPNVVRKSASQAEFNTMIGTVANNAAGFIAIGY